MESLVGDGEGGTRTPADDRGGGRSLGNGTDFAENSSLPLESVDLFSVDKDVEFTFEQKPDRFSGRTLVKQGFPLHDRANLAGLDQLIECLLGRGSESVRIPEQGDEFVSFHVITVYPLREKGGKNRLHAITISGGGVARGELGFANLLFHRIFRPVIMKNTPSQDPGPEPVEIQCYFVRERNALAVRGRFSPLYTDYYIHLLEHQVRYSAEDDLALKDALAALTLHLASRPWNEAIAWTLSWQDPLKNVFVTGSNRQGNVTGRVFTEDVRERENNLFYVNTIVDGQAGRQSMIEVDRFDFFHIGERYYDQSEQRLGRYFRHSDEDYLLITSQPDCDLAWLESLDDDAIRTLDSDEELSLLETRVYQFDCGCSQDRIFPLIASMSDEVKEEIFGNSETLPASCPRCGARYIITREALEAFVKANA